MSAATLAAMAGLASGARSASVAIDEFKSALPEKPKPKRQRQRRAAMATTAINRMPHQGEREKARRRCQLAAGQIHFIQHGPKVRAADCEAG